MAQEVIELGEVGAEPRTGHDLPPPGRWARWVAAVVAAALAALPGASAPHRPLVTQARAVAIDPAAGLVKILPLGDVLLVGDAREISAYELADGSRRWRRPSAGTELHLAEVPAGAPGMLLLYEGDYFGEGHTMTSVVDLATGRPLWSSRGMIHVVGELAVEYPARAEFDGEVDQSALPPREVPVRDLRTGRVRWTLRGAPYTSVDATTGEAWSISPQGRYTVYGLPDGRVLRTGTVAFPPGRPEYAHAFEGTLLVSAVDGGERREIRYDNWTLREIGEPDGALRYPCGPYLCRLDGERQPVVVLDAGTGAVRYRLGEQEQLVVTGAGAVTLRYDEPAEIGVGQQIPQVTSAGRLIDPADGRTLRELDGWGALVEPGDNPELLLVRRVPGALQLARIDCGQVRVLGAVRPDPVGCWFARQRLACRYDDQLVIWRITW